jgi:hypothetical protein
VLSFIKEPFQKRGAPMTRRTKPTAPSFRVKLCIWSIRNQSWLAGQVRIYIYGATALLAFLALAGAISIETALLSAFCGGAIMLCLIWTFIHQRKTLLLSIDNPEVRDQALSAMVDYLRGLGHKVELPAHIKAAIQDTQSDCRECDLPR